MSKKIVVSISLFFVGSIFVFAQNDLPGSKDHPLFTRMPNYYIMDYEEKEFGSYDFYDSKNHKFTVEGRTYSIAYKIKEGAKASGDLEIRRNYVNAIKTIGGTILKDSEYGADMKIARNGREIWAQIRAETDGETYALKIVEKGEIIQEVTANAAYFAENINQTGHIAVYGLYFDTGKAEVKPESEPTLKEIAKLLGQNPSLKLNVVGHTDNVGDFGFNMKLSQARADSVVKMLTSNYGVDMNRLAAYGVGSLAPVASNKTEEGRAKNRRVELVER